MNRTMHRPARPTALAVLVFSLATGLVFGAASPASACSCAGIDLVADLPEEDGAFVGTYVDRTAIGDGQVAYTFQVERVVKGEFGPTAIVRSTADGASCGLEFSEDRRTGLLLRQADDGVWESGLCSMVEPARLLAAGGDRPPDPEVAAVSAGWSTATKTIALAAGLVVLLALVLLPLARVAVRSASSPDRTDVA
jgi:hypothetical protein